MNEGTFHCKRCGRAIFARSAILDRVNLWDLREYQAEAYAISELIDPDGLRRYDVSLHEGWYCCQFIAMRMVVDKFGTGDKLLVYADAVVEALAGASPPVGLEDKGQVRLTARDFDGVLGSPSLQDELLVVKFGAIWCPPCRLMDAVIGRIGQDGSLPGVRFFEVDVDHEPELAARFDIRSIPFLAFFHRGRRLHLTSDRLPTADGALTGGQGRAVLERVCVTALSRARGGSSILRV